MSHLSLEDIFPEEVADVGHMRVGMTHRWVCENRVEEGVTTLGEVKAMTRQYLLDEGVQRIITAELAALPADYDPWIWAIERRRHNAR